jgi:hypothetical protein
MSGEFVAFGGRGHRLGSNGEIIPHAAPSEGQPQQQPDERGEAAHPMLNSEVVDVEGGDDGDGRQPADDERDEQPNSEHDEFVVAVEGASLRLKNIMDTMLVVQGWIEKLGDNKWTEKLKHDASRLLADM